MSNSNDELGLCDMDTSTCLLFELRTTVHVLHVVPGVEWDRI